jgi:hypothetical protein
MFILKLPRNDDSGELVDGRTTANSFHKNSVSRLARNVSGLCFRRETPYDFQGLMKAPSLG